MTDRAQITIDTLADVPMFGNGDLPALQPAPNTTKINVRISDEALDSIEEMYFGMRKRLRAKGVTLTREVMYRAILTHAYEVWQQNPDTNRVMDILQGK